MIERLAIWFLGRRGRVVLPRQFVGFAIGFGRAVKQQGSVGYDVWEITVPKGSRFIAINNSIVLMGDADPRETP